MCSYKNCCFIAAKWPFAAARARILQLQTCILQRQLYFYSCKNRDHFEVTKLAASKLPLAFLPPENMQQICGSVQRTPCCANAQVRLLFRRCKYLLMQWEAFFPLQNCLSFLQLHKEARSNSQSADPHAHSAATHADWFGAAISDLWQRSTVVIRAYPPEALPQKLYIPLQSPLFSRWTKKRID